MGTRQRDAEQARSTETGSEPRKQDVIAEIGIRLLDDAQMAWQQAELECGQALTAWRDGAPALSADGYLRYRAALDREEAAARDLQRLWEVARWGHEALTAATP